MSIGITSGVFDKLHKGHLNFLYECKKKCNLLIVGIDEDILVKLKKGYDRPIDNQNSRLKNLSQTRLASKIFIKKYNIEYYFFYGIKYYFIPLNKKLSNEREKFLKSLNILVIRIPYSSDISTTKLINIENQK